MSMRFKLLSVLAVLTLFAALPQAYGQFILWCDSNAPAIKRANLDGSNTTVLISSGLSSPYGIAIDVDGGKLYWSDTTLNQIKRSNLDGTNSETINFNAPSAGGVALDTVNGKIYWSQGSLDRDIFRSNLDGSSIELVINNTSTGGPQNIAIDVAGAKVYWTEPFNGFAKRADMNGSNQQTIFMGGTTTIPVSGITLDIPNSKVYLGDVNGNLFVVNFDGSNPQSLGSIANGVDQLAFDSLNRKLYYGDEETDEIGNVNTDGTDSVTLIDTSSAGAPRALALLLPTPTPTPTVTPTPVPTLRPLTPGTTIDVAPTVTVTDRSVTLFLEEFSQVLITSRAISVRTAAPEVRYDVRISRDQGGDSRRKMSKKNEVTFNRLKPGSYKGKYKASIVQKRSKSQRKKAEQRGKKGFQARYRTVSRTNFSPSTSFTIQ